MTVTSVAARSPGLLWTPVYLIQPIAYRNTRRNLRKPVYLLTYLFTCCIHFTLKFLQHRTNLRLIY